MGVDSYLKMEAFWNYVQSQEKEKYSQFTKDFIESWLYKDDKIKETLKECVLALSYEVEEILQIINPLIEDYKFFFVLNKMIKE
jgi:hypothetical protein